MLRTRSTHGVASVVLLLAAVACTPDEPDPERAATDTVIPSATQTPADAAATPASPAPTAGTVPVNARLTEWSVELSTDTIPAGVVSFQVTNAGTLPHALEVEGEGIEEETPPLDPGGSAVLTLELRPGTYEVYCPVEDSAGNHQGRGMRTRLVVRG